MYMYTSLFGIIVSFFVLQTCLGRVENVLDKFTPFMSG